MRVNSIRFDSILSYKLEQEFLALSRLFRKVGDSNLQNYFLNVEQSVSAVIESILLLSLSQYVQPTKRFVLG